MFFSLMAFVTLWILVLITVDYFYSDDDTNDDASRRRLFFDKIIVDVTNVFFHDA